MDMPSVVKCSHPADSTVCLQTRYLPRLTPPSMFYSQDTAWNVIDNNAGKQLHLECESREAALHLPESIKLHIALHSAYIPGKFVLHRFCNLFVCLNEAGRSYLVIHVTGQFSPVLRVLPEMWYSLFYHVDVSRKLRVLAGINSVAFTLEWMHNDYAIADHWHFTCPSYIRSRHFYFYVWQHCWSDFKQFLSYTRKLPQKFIGSTISRSLTVLRTDVS
jgi:hypothetical protein